MIKVMLIVFFLVVAALMALMIITGYQTQKQKYEKIKLDRAKMNMHDHCATPKDYNMIIEE